MLSTSFSRGRPITDVAAWLGHRDINVTFSVYGHLVPSSMPDAVETLNSEYAEWSEVA
jgi:integrase